jgi:hypothetical protein
MTIPLSYTEAQLLYLSGSDTEWASPFSEKLSMALDTQGWWEAFDTAELSDSEIEALVNHAFLRNVVKAMGADYQLENGNLPREVYTQIRAACTSWEEKSNRALQSIRQKIAECEGVSQTEFRLKEGAVIDAVYRRSTDRHAVSQFPEEHPDFVAKYRKPGHDVFGQPLTCTSCAGEWGCE